MLDVMFAAIFVGAGLIMVAAFTSVLGYRLGAPLLLVFLCLGLLFGEDGVGIAFDDASLAYFIGSLALAVILFDSGFGTRISTFRIAAAPAVVLATVGVALTALFVGLAAHYLLGFPMLEAFLIGAIISSTDAAAVFFLLRVGGITIRERIRSTLEVESGANDPMAIFLTIALVELILAEEGGAAAWTELVLMFVRQMGLGLILGFAGGFAIVRILNRIQLDPGLYPIAVLAAALVLFGAVGSIEGSGFLAVYVAGLYVGNQQLPGMVSLRRFQDGIIWFAQITMFLVLGLLATPSAFPDIALPAIALALFLTLIGRPVAVWLCLLPFRYRPDETAFISWVGLRGAVSILLGILPLAQGLPNGQFFFDTAFIVVLTSLLIQGWTIRPTARLLGLIVPPSIGPVEKIELELPGAAHHELVSYRVVPDSPVARGERLPRWARPSLVIRDGRSMRYQYAGRLQPGDRVYIFIAPRYTRLLDRLFASPVPLEADDKEFFGEFTVDPERPVKELAETYDVDLDGADPDTPIAALIERRLGGRAEIGDRVACGSVELVVREVEEDGLIKRVGLAIEPQPSRSANIPLFLNARQLLQWIRKSKALGGSRDRLE